MQKCLNVCALLALRQWLPWRKGAWASNQIQPPLGDTSAIAVGADAADDEGVAVRLEMMLPADVVNDRADGFVLELDDFAALLTDQVFMRRVAVIVLVGASIRQAKLAEQPRFD